MSIAGFGTAPFQAGGGWWWVPILGPIAGALLGILTHFVFVGRKEEDEETGE